MGTLWQYTSYQNFWETFSKRKPTWQLIWIFGEHFQGSLIFYNDRKFYFRRPAFVVYNQTNLARLSVLLITRFYLNKLHVLPQLLVLLIIWFHISNNVFLIFRILNIKTLLNISLSGGSGKESTEVQITEEIGKES